MLNDTKQAREGQINQELQSAEKSCDRLITKLDVLEEMLTSVLQKECPATKPESPKDEDLVPLACRIRRHHMLLRDLGDRLESIHNRLEIR